MEKLNFSTTDEVGHSSAKHYLRYRLCPICNSAKYSKVFSLTDFQFFTDSNLDSKIATEITQVQCSSCSTIFMNPCYSDDGFRVLFSEAGQSYGSTEIRPTEQIGWLNQRGLLKESNKVLDIGCYEGSFLALLPDNVFKLGVDVDFEAIKRGREKFKNIEFFCSKFEEFNCSMQPDTITMFHVLEHVTEPVSVLRRLNLISHDQTRLVVEVPIIENGQTNDINGFFSVQHITQFSRSSLKSCFVVSGWEIIEWVEVSEYNGCRVLLKKCEPKEFLNNVCTSNEVFNLYTYLSSWYNSVANVEKELQEIPNECEIVIWGAGLHTEFVYQLTTLFKSNKRKFILVDSDKLKQNKSWRGFNIYNPSVLSEVDWNSTYLIVSSYGGQSSISESALKLSVPDNRIVKLYKNIKRY